MRIDWTPEETSALLKLITDKPKCTYKQYAEALTKQFKRQFSEDSVRARHRRIKNNATRPQQPATGTEERIQHKDTIEIHKDGSQSSNRLLHMSAEESKDVNYLLRAHGYDLNAWELIGAKNKIWNAYSKVHGISTLYSSSITVKPKKAEQTLQQLIEAMKDVKPISFKVESFSIEDKRLLEVSLFDAHFGISDYEYYKPTQSRILEKLSSRKWEETLFIIGQDMLHVDNFRNQTANGTPIEQVDLAKAWNDCRTFYEPLIDVAIKRTRRVKIMYIKGNHDESLSWAFVQFLKSRYPQANIDDSFVERKAHTFGANFIGITHGDKARKNLHNIYPVEFPEQWAKAKNRELHIGHLHVEDARDVFGMVVRTLATRNKTDRWHKENGFVGAHKRFMIFEYSEDELESIHYV